jgi:hypothetical protein
MSPGRPHWLTRTTRIVRDILWLPRDYSGVRVGNAVSMRVPTASREILHRVFGSAARLFGSWEQALAPPTPARYAPRCEMSPAGEAILSQARREGTVWTPDSVAPHLKGVVSHLER